MVTESLAHAHLAGTSFRPDRLQLIDENEAELSSLLQVLILLVGFFDLVVFDVEVLVIGIFFVDIVLEIFDDEAASVDDNTVFRLRIVLTLRCGWVVVTVRFFTMAFLVNLLFLEDFFNRIVFSRRLKVLRFTEVLKVGGFVADLD